MNQNIASASQKRASNAADRLPWAGLLALAMAGFICILTETIPAGLLSQISDSLGVSEALVGQLVTLYALGSLIAAIPVITVTRGWRRRPLLLMCIVGFLLFNTITALSFNYTIILVARFFAGVSAGVVWGMTAVYARRMVVDSLKGRAMAVAMIGSPLAMALGVPIGTSLGVLVGWRIIFGIMSLLSLLLMIWMLWKLPDFAGQSSGKRLSLQKVFVMPGVRAILLVVLIWVLAHNILYTYIAPFLAKANLTQHVDLVLFIFGVTSVVGIWLIGMWIDRRLRLLVLISLSGFALASVLLGIGSSLPVVIYIGIAIWGLTFGGAATLTQTAIAEAAGENVDVAQSMLVTAWNIAIGAGGVIGGIFLETLGVGNFPWVMCILLLLTLAVAWRAREHGFRSGNDKPYD